ncbi:nuclear transport factor 2 family protein [Aquimarina pacifica]|uniref:nuclear transport factor 2 family protein n=1 Tax=Aquimarina pacifica TaxID=1296415 RepID=UPI0004AFA74B|nr:nuclear transport factor 2 family protein [Aquimarina pacifica]
MKQLFLLLILLNSYSLFSQSAYDQIQETLQNYLQGTSYNRPEQIKKGFHEDANLYLTNKEKSLWIVPIVEYAGWFAKREKDVFNGRKGKILAVDIENDIAMAKAEITQTKNSKVYIDIFLLKRIEGAWKIISKAATTRN